jgi:hypothetical protein
MLTSPFLITELQATVHCFIYSYASLGFGNDRRVSRAFQWFMYHPLWFLIFRDSKAGMVPSTVGMCRYISRSEIVCCGPKKFENPWFRRTCVIANIFHNACAFSWKAKLLCNVSTRWKVKVTLSQTTKPQKGLRYISTLSLTSALDRVAGQRHALAAIHPVKTR